MFNHISTNLGAIMHMTYFLAASINLEVKRRKGCISFASPFLQESHVLFLPQSSRIHV